MYFFRILFAKDIPGLLKKYKEKMPTTNFNGIEICNGYKGNDKLIHSFVLTDGDT
jgi:hypothetical protein